MSVKLLALCGVLGVALAVPRIELDLAQSGSLSPAHPDLASLGSAMYSSAEAADETPLKAKDWVLRCPAGTKTTAVNCPLPSAKSYDHEDKLLDGDVTPSVYLVDHDGDADFRTTYPNGLKVTGGRDDVDFTTRAMYLFKFDAVDEAGNHAEQVVFALILDDTAAPAIAQCTPNSVTTLEAETAEYLSLCWDDRATDNLDADVSPSLRYEIIQSSDGSVVLSGGTRAQAEAAWRAIGGRRVDTYAIAVSAHDDAGAYGHKQADNVAMASRQVRVVDTTKPEIEVAGFFPAVHECTHAYDDADYGGASATDTVEGDLAFDGSGVCRARDDASVATCFKVTGNVQTDVVSKSFHVSYSARDRAGNAAVTAVRPVHVVDTTPPEVELIGDNPLNYRATSKNALVDPGIKCVDACDKSEPYRVDKQWIGDPLTAAKKVGTYTLRYTCYDASGNPASVDRDVVVSDGEAPLLTLKGGPAHTPLEANANCLPGLAPDCYVEERDGGAACVDFHEGPLAPTVSGNPVNMKVPGTYRFEYTCKDTAGHVATPVTREVVIEDRTPPTVRVEGALKRVVEAGFPYVDFGLSKGKPAATAQDSLDGPLAQCAGNVPPQAGEPGCWWSEGDTVEVRVAFRSRRSCKEIKASYSAAPTGEYEITVWQGEQFKRERVWCDMTTKVDGVAHGFTFKRRYATSGAIVPYDGDEGECGQLGMEMANFWESNALLASARRHFCGAGDHKPCPWIPRDPTQTTNTYLCAINDIKRSTAGYITQAEKDEEAKAGVYVISYHVQDKAGNREVAAPTRTVEVRDTLPPVISLKWMDVKNSVIQVSKHSANNPAGIVAKSSQNQFLQGENILEPQTGVRYTIPEPAFDADAQLLAEQPAGTSARGWAAAGVAAGVAGLALLGFSARRRAVVGVPV
eukprot:g3118.t1